MQKFTQHFNLATTPDHAQNRIVVVYKMQLFARNIVYGVEKARIFLRVAHASANAIRKHALVLQLVVSVILIYAHVVELVQILPTPQL